MPLTVPDTLEDRRIDAALAALCADYSRTTLKAWIEAGRVRLNGAIEIRPRTPVHAGDVLELTVEVAPASDDLPQAVPLRVAYEDEALLVIDKPAGLVVHPGAGNPDHTLVNGLLHRYPALSALPRAGVVHRLDKDTTGLLLVARTSRAYQRLVRQLAAREISRVYAALVHGTPRASGSVSAALARDRVQRTRMRVSAAGREAVTHYRVLAQFARHAHLELALETGRTHQIRVHMQHLGHPLLGDPTYGRHNPPDPGQPVALARALAGLARQALHARVLELEHPETGELLRVASPLPRDFQRVLRALRAGAKAGQEMAE